MKKILLCFVAVAALASCVKEQTIQTPEKMAISFSQFVNNSNSKAAIDPTFNNTVTPLNEFYVWGFMTSNTGVVFDKELVSRVDAQSPWTYTNLAYWAPGRTYKFAAVAPVASVDGDIKITLADNNKYMSQTGVLGTISFTNKTGDVDVLYAKDEVVTPDPLAADPEKVELTFAHLLSKIKFTFTNRFVNENITLAVSDVKMVVPAEGDIDLSVMPYAWVVKNSTTVLDFGKAINKVTAVEKLGIDEAGEVEHERLTIPIATTQSIISSYAVSFNVTIYNGTEVAQVVPMTSTIVGTSFVPGKCYNLTADLNATNLGLKVIEFTATVEDWVNGGDLGFLN